MVNLLGGSEFVLSFTFLAKWIRFDISVTDAFPRPAVSFVVRGVAFVLVVELVCFFQMLGAVLLTNLSEEAATGIGTGPLWFIWHCVTSFGIKKSPTGVTCKACVILF